jgi:hypothetical protein
MPTEFRPATIENVGVWISIAGGSRSGKTRSALRLARGLVGPQGRIAAIDTEGRRMSHHSKIETFDVLNMESPYDPLRFADIARDAQAQGYGCLIIDSFSLEWTGVGGVLDRFDREFERKGKRENTKDICWAEAKKPHKQMRDFLMQLSMPVIFCLRCNEIPKHLGGGWKVEHDKRWMYEWTVGLTLHPDSPGMPCFDMLTAKGEDLCKFPDDDVRAMFPPGQLIGEEAGAGLAKWRAGEAARQRATSTGDKQREAADRLIDRIAAAGSKSELSSITEDGALNQWRFRLASKRPELEAELKAAVAAKELDLTPPGEDERPVAGTVIGEAA